MSSVRAPWLVIGFAALVPLVFAAFTGHAWEDYFITLRSSRNLVEGHGLVFNPGERVHTFTSPLGVLVPALCTAIAGVHREELALWLFRAINAGFLAAMAGLLWRRSSALGLGTVGFVTLFGLLLTDAKLIDFSINGMETAMLVFFVVLLWSELETSNPRATHIALATAGLMWTRPDAFILGGAIVLSRLVIPLRRRHATPRPGIALWRGLLVGGLLYAPWFAWAWWYYGTPVPHTVIAKAAYTPPVELGNLLLAPVQTLMGRSMLVDLFLPAYATFGGWPSVLNHVAHALSAIAAFIWLLPGVRAPGRRASFAVFLGMFYLCSIVLFPWYVPPWTALAIIALAFLADSLHASAVALGRRALATILRTSCVALVALSAVTLAAVAWQMRIEQRFVEIAVRRSLGEWLAANAAPTDTVFLEPLGYIGYFSQLKTYDFPGLSSPEVVAAVRSGARRYADVIDRLRPDWVVLRPAEAQREEFKSTAVLRHYELVRVWDALPQLDQVRVLPGRLWVEGEARFLLFRRKRTP